VAFTSSYLTRGNQTKVTNWILSPLIPINSYSQYDIAGNVVEVIDGRGYSTTIGYADCFGTPNGEARTNIAPNELATQSQTSYALATSVTNALGQSSYAQYDYYLGRPVDAEDINGIEASGYFSDALDRPTKIVRAVGTSVSNQTTYVYDDTNRIITTTSDFDSLNDPSPLKSQTLYDGMGRPKETRQYEGGTNYIAVQTQFDALGRAFKTSNPFRPWQSETAVWTTSVFDMLGRVTSITTPDNAVVLTSYGGNTVTATDQAGKKRKSVTDALGRLTHVYEDPTTLNYLTSYAYDVLDNLTTVTQGVQTRTFVYDSLKRLKTATNPESGTINYTYDNNSNLLTKVDARPITTTFSYDALNRPTLKNYSDPTPDVAYFYDAQTLPAGAPAFVRGSSTGRLVAVTTGGTNAGTYRGYDELGRVVRQYQRTDSNNYLVEATYNSSSALLTEKYPAVGGAIRTVTYSYDAAGRVASLNSAATSYAPAANVNSMSYTSRGALASETLGNGLLHAQVYNNRLQTTAIKLGTAALPTSVLNLTYNYGTTTNNGNVLSATYAGGGLSYTQTFGYDALNRLTSSQEGATWSQTNSYDRYGNRAIVGAALTFNANNNRITSAGYVYDAVGNLINDSTQSFTYDAENKITKVNNVSAYAYDGEGQRVGKLLGENLRFIYDMGGKQIAEFNGATGSLKKEYIYGATDLVATIEPTAVNANGTRYITSDHLGSPRVVTDSPAAVVSRHDYKPFGEEIGAGIGGRTTGMGYSVADGLRQKFTQKERDNETGLDFFEARYYSSGQGRFSSVDPENAGASLIHPQSWNGYSYSLNNPLRFIDPDGLRWAQIQVEGGIQYQWFDHEEKDDNGQTAYDRALASGYSAVDFNESKSFEYSCECGGGGDRYGNYRLNPDGSHGYADVLDGNYHAMSTDWNAQLAIGGRLKSVMGVVGGLIDAIVGGATKSTTQVVTTQVAKNATEIVAKDGTKITGLVKHGVNRAIGDGAKRAGTRPEAILDALKNPTTIKEGVDKLGRPFKIFEGTNARVVVNPQTGKIVSTNPLSGAGAH
jgi:RHS repeat-associated protein